ncbi:unnamed protein product [marine sediment metagenome]|uniref:Uncharacterized protein n=1 Tax=marine sediment metagenome TaxID=412755 RepID=X1N427_9ZZZZ
MFQVNDPEDKKQATVKSGNGELNTKSEMPVQKGKKEPSA